MNAINYMKNVGKSFGYIVNDVVKEYNPAIYGLTKSAKDLTSDIYKSIDDFKTNISSQRSEQSLNGQVKDTTKDLFKNIYEDVKSGNWYNKQRISKLDSESMGFDFSFDDSDFDFDFEDDEISDSTKVEVSQEEKNTKEIIDSIDFVGYKTAQSISMTTIESANYIATSQRESTKALYSMTNRGFGEVTKGIAAINANISIISSIAKPMNDHMQNSLNFYIKNTEYQEKSLKLLEKIAENTTTKSATSRKSSRARNTIDDLLSDGVLDLQAYKDMIVKNTKDTFSMFTSMFGLMGGMGGKNFLKNEITKSPISTALTFGLKQLMPKVMKESMKEFNEYLDGFFATYLGSLKDKNGGPLFELLKGIITPNSGYKSSINTGDYIKGKVDWDGMSRKALMDVIPFQLSEIVSALTGKPQRVYDYQTGKWKNVNTVKSDFQKFKNEAADSATYEFMYELKQVVEDLAKSQKMSEEQSKAMIKQLYSFNRTAFHSDSSDFLNFEKDNFNYAKYGLDENTWNLLRNYTTQLKKNNKGSKVTRFTGNIMRERARFGNRLRDMESEGSIYNLLFDDSIKDQDKSRTLLGVDKYNNDIYYYLQGIYQYTKHVSDNLEVFAPGGSSLQGTRIDNGGTIKPIKKIRKSRNINKEEVENKRNSIINTSSISSKDINVSINKSYGKYSDEIRGLSPEQKDYYIKKRTAFDNDEQFENDPRMDREIERIQEMYKKGSKFKQSIQSTAVGKIAIQTAEKIMDLFKVPTDIITGLLESTENTLSGFLYGIKDENGEEKSGILDIARTGFGDLFSDLKEKINKFFPIDKFRSVFNKIFGEKGEDGKRHGSIFSGFANETADELRNAGKWVKNVFTGSKVFSNGMAANGRRVTKTGVVAVSEGELIIPAEYNPFYNKKINKSKQIAGEYNAINRFFGAYNNGGTIGAEGYYQDDKGIWYRPDGKKASKEEIKKLGLGQTKSSGLPEDSFLGKLMSTVSKGLDNAKSGAGNLFNEFFPNNKKLEEDKKKISELVESSLDGFKKYKGAMGAGALIGGGVSLLTGAAISPILAAGIGAATGLIIKSDKVQKVLFGDEEKDGLLPKNVSKFIKENVPSMAKGGVIGAAGGLFMGSPVLGAILGSTVGYINSSEKAKGFLFGHGDVDDGMFSKALQEKLKKALPNMSVGAIAGLLAGPFGPLGNILVGSTVGYAAGTDKFQNWLFGEKGKDGKREGGFAGLIKDNFVKPITGIFDHLAQEIKHTIRNTFHNLGKGIRKLFTNFFKGTVGGSRVGRALGKAANFVTGGAVRGIGRVLNTTNDAMQRRSLRKGYRIRNSAEGRNMTAEERMNLRESLGVASEDGRYGKFGTIDQILSSAQSEQELNDLQNLTKIMLDPTKEFDHQKRAARTSVHNILNNKLNSFSDSDFKFDRKSYKNVYKLLNSGKIDEAIEAAEKLSGMSVQEKQNLIDSIEKYRTAISNSDLALNDSAKAKAELLKDSKYSKLVGKFGVDKFVNLNDADVMNMQDLINDERSRFGKEKMQEEADKATVKIPDLLEKIIDKLDYIGNVDKFTETGTSVPTTIAAKNKFRNATGFYKDSNGHWHRPDGKFASKEEIERVKTLNLSPEDTIINKDKEDNNSGPEDGDVAQDDELNKKIRYNGKWEYDMTDTTTKQNIERKNKIYDAIMHIPFISSGVNALGGIFSGIKNLFTVGGNSSSESNSLFSDINNSKNEENTLGSILKSVALPAIFVAGSYSGFFDEFFHKLGLFGDPNNETLLGSTGYQTATGETLIKGEDGKFYTEDGQEWKDSVYTKLSDYSNRTSSYSERFKLNEVRQLITNRGRNFTTKAIDGFGKLGGHVLSKIPGLKNTKFVQTLKKGPINQLTENISKNFNMKLYNKSAKTLAENGISTTITKSNSKFKKLLTKIPGLNKFVSTTNVDFSSGNSFNRIFKSSTEVVDEAGNKLVKKGLNIATETTLDATRASIDEASQKGLKFFFNHIPDLVKKVPGCEKLFKALDLDKLFKKLSTTITEKIAKGSARAVADCSYAFPPLGVILDVIFFVSDFAEGWQNANEIFEITQEPTIGMKFISGLLKALVGLIPYVGPLIPIEDIMNIFIDFCEIAGIVGEDFKEARIQGREEVNNYNKYHGTNYDFSEYNKKILKNNVWYEKLWQDVKSTASKNFNTNWNIIKKTFTGGYKETGFKGLVTEVADAELKFQYDNYCEDLKTELRDNMRETEGSIDEERLEIQYTMAIETFLNSEDGKKYYKYYYGVPYSDAKRAEFENKVKEWKDSSSEDYKNATSTDTKLSWSARLINTISNNINSLKNDNSGNNTSSPTSQAQETINKYAQAYENKNINQNAGVNNYTSNWAAANQDIINKWKESNSGGASFISQRDIKYANMRLGNSTVQNKGCGPAAAVMALNQYAGNSMENAVNFAQGYQTNGGTDASFFADYYRSNGTNAVYYDGASKYGQSNIVNNISNGIPVILMGQDLSNKSKNNSPFGPNNHYVVATGFDASGNVIINDPELKSGNKKYSSRILNKVKIGIGMGASGSRLFRFGLSGGSTTYSHELRVDDTTKFIWTFFRKLGYSEAATAGIMGNLQQESGIDPTRFQTNGGPGRGLAQWTVTERFVYLEKYAKEMGRDWTDLEAQCMFIDHEINGSQKSFFKKQAGSIEEFKCLTDVEDATVKFEKAYERAGSPNYTKRKEYAIYYYENFTGKIYNNISVSSTSISHNENEKESSFSLGSVLPTFSAISDAFSIVGDYLSGNKNSNNNSSLVNGATAGLTIASNTINANPNSISYSGSTPVELLRNIAGKIEYSMKGARDPEKGSADCSSTVNWAFKKATGKDIGSYTGAQYTDSDLSTVWYNNGKVATSLPSNIKENDILFFSRPTKDWTKGRPDRVGHVEVYTGNGKMIGHGGPGLGPTEKNVPLGEGSNGGLIKVARLVDNNSASGSGLIRSSLKGSSKLLFDRSMRNAVNYYEENNSQYKHSSLYSGGDSSVSRKVSNGTNKTISKDTALLLRTMITLIESIVNNTEDIHNIYTVLCNMINKEGIDSKVSSSVKEAISKIESSSSSSKIESQLSSLKATVDSILAG